MNEGICMPTTDFKSEDDLNAFAKARADDPSPLPLGGYSKRLFDIVFASLALLMFGGVMIAIAIALKLIEGGPVFFAHQRVGANGKKFPCWKFRTMVQDAEERLAHILATDPVAAAEYINTRKLRNDPRIIPLIGVFLRKTSLDELPQFVNVLMGQMSIVGPRPVTEDEWVQNFGRQHCYTSARPGITGLWQTSGRNDVSFAERVRMDAAYIRNWSFLRDLQIILRTFSTVCVQRNGY